MILSWVIEHVKTLRAAQYYGKLTIHFERGKIVLLRKEETIKPPNNGGNNEGQKDHGQD